MDSHPCIVEVGHKRPHFLTLFVIDGFGPWEHLLDRRGYVELVPVVVDFPQTMRPAQLMPLEASVGPTSRTGQRVGPSNV